MRLALDTPRWPQLGSAKYAIGDIAPWQFVVEARAHYRCLQLRVLGDRGKLYVAADGGHVSHPETYNGSEYLNICRVTDITRSVNSIHQVSVVRTPIVRKRSDPRNASV